MQHTNNQTKGYYPHGPGTTPYYPTVGGWASAMMKAHLPYWRIREAGGTGKQGG